MLKKAGFVVAVATAAMFAASPLAFAVTVDDDPVTTANTQAGVNPVVGVNPVLNITGNNLELPVQALCNNDVPTFAVPVEQGQQLTAALGLLGTPSVGDSTSTVSDARTCGQFNAKPATP